MLSVSDNSRYNEAVKKFVSLFGAGEGIEVYSAPGRTEIGGNHTDHQHGQVLAASIDRDSIAVVRPNGSGVINVISGDYPKVEVNLNDLLPCENEKGHTSALVRGMAAGLKSLGFVVKGFDAYVTSDVLIGAGLSSSASFEVLIGTVISGLFNEGKADAITIAKAAQACENEFFGKPCGLMDQMACSVGNLVYIDFDNPSEPLVERIDFDFDASGYVLCITNTHGSHSDLTAEYAAVPSEMTLIANLLGKNFLRETTGEEILENISMLREKAGDRAVLRALHFAGETKRAKAEADALLKGDMSEFIRLVNESGNSSYKYLQNIYVSSNPRQQNVSIALCVSDSILEKDEAVRVHGGGFAGTIQAFVKKENAPRYKTSMDAIFGEGSCEILNIRKSGGIRIL